MKRWFPGVWVVCALALLTGTASAAPSAATLSGLVRDAQGTPQMGALVQVLSADATVIATAFSDSHGRYIVASIAPGQYRLRASAAFFAPVTRDHLLLIAGRQAVVNLTMSTLFELSAWFPAEARRADEPADDWKWTLRSAASRPLLRLDDDSSGDAAVSSSADRPHRADTATRVAVTSGDGTFGRGGVHQVLALTESMEDGSAATLLTDIGEPQLPFTGEPSGEISAGYELRGAFGSSTRIVTSYASHPEVTGSGGQGVSTLRVVSAERLQLGDAVQIDAGTLLLAERLAATDVLSAPFVRADVHFSPMVSVEYRFASAREAQSSDDLDHLAPRSVALADAAGRPVSSFGTHHELAVAVHAGHRETLTVAAYKGAVSHSTLNGSGLLERADEAGVGVLADASTATFRLTGAGYADQGLSAQWTQALTQVLSAGLAVDYGTAQESQLPQGTVLAAVAPQLRARMEPAASVTLRGRVLRSGTVVRAGYRWQPQRVLTQVNSYNVADSDAYLSFKLRQRLQCGRLLPHGLEAVVEATNLLEQGYQPVVSTDGRTLFLAQVPRAVEGGISFTF